MPLTVIPRGPEPPAALAEFFKFVCPPTFGGGPLDPQTPTRLVRRTLDTMISIPLPASVAAITRAAKDNVTAWIIEDPDDSVTGRTFPSPIIRTVEHDVVQADVGASLNTHTIHWHGIEPTTMNDGVGHTSFEVTGHFTYQFATNTAGTYFYHCHKNTVLHFEMGLYGLLVVDPANPNTADPVQAPYATGGPGFLRANVPAFPGFDPVNFVVPYEVEALWVTDDFDSIWHDLGHNAFMQNCDKNNPNAAGNFTQDGFLNNFIPDIFFVSGLIPDVVSGDLNNLPIVLAPITPATVTPTGPPASVVSPTVQVGQTLLVRLLNAGYTIQEYTIGTPADSPNLDATVVATDGHPFGIPGTDDQYSSPFVIPAGMPFRLTTARRLDLLFRPTQAGTYFVTIKHIDWVKSKSAAEPNQDLVWGIQRVAINVVPAI